MQGLKRRIIHSVLFEVIALAIFIPLSALFLDGGMAHLGVLAVTLSLIAMGWNMLFNKLFELWEARQVSQTRTVKRRVMHAIGFEFGLTAFSLPLIAWIMDMGLWEALITDIGFMLFYLVFALVFNWSFDRVFGLPTLKPSKRQVSQTV